MSDINVNVQDSILNTNKDGTQIIGCQTIHGKGCTDDKDNNDRTKESEQSPHNRSQPIKRSLPVEDDQKKKTDTSLYDNMEYPQRSSKEKSSANSESSQRLLYLALVYLIIFGGIVLSIKFVENWWMLPIAILGSVLTFSTILTFHQNQEGTIDKQTFLSLMFENLKRLTMIQTLVDSILSFSRSSRKSNSIQGRRTRKK